MSLRRRQGRLWPSVVQQVSFKNKNLIDRNWIAK